MSVPESSNHVLRNNLLAAVIKHENLFRIVSKDLKSFLSKQ